MLQRSQRVGGTGGSRSILRTGDTDRTPESCFTSGNLASSIDTAMALRMTLTRPKLDRAQRFQIAQNRLLLLLDRFNVAGCGRSRRLGQHHPDLDPWATLCGCTEDGHRSTHSKAFAASS